jgi:hypothetical protein
MYIAIVHEKGQYDDSVKYEFSTLEEAREFLKAMQGVLITTDFYKKEERL